ncbi:MAG: iron ABC transporter permease [Candidatus Omnitrophica bacterium]|nr:iron ABC transporter permease [Candidatus Omnitrophota bacterium]
MRRKSRASILILTVAFFAMFFLCILKGTAPIPPGELFQPQFHTILFLRLLRVLMAIIAGIGLSVSGIVLQALLRNPLAEPYLLGTSSGAGLGVLLAILLGVSSFLLPLAGFLTALITLFLVYRVAVHNGRIPIHTLVLSGAILSVALSAIIVFIISITANETLHDVMWWLWGSMQVYELPLFIIVAVIVTGGVALVFFFSRELDIFCLGEEEAVHAGISVENVKKILLGIVSLITASLVSLCGVIGFVGLIIPHMMRLCLGARHRQLLIGTVIASSVFMMACDLIARTAFAPVEIPIGVITALLGAPLFIILLKRKQRIQ